MIKMKSLAFAMVLRKCRGLGLERKNKYTLIELIQMIGNIASHV